MKGIARPDIKPAFAERNIPVVFATDENYLPYVKAAVNSAVANAAGSNLDILILHSGMSDESIQALISRYAGIESVSVRFVDMSDALTESRLADFKQVDRLPVSTCYRLLAPSILTAYDKLIYLDVDVAVCRDLCELYATDPGDCYFAAAGDVVHSTKPEYLSWAAGWGFTEWDGYVNAGVLVMNLKKIREDRLEERFISLLAKDYTFADQDILNVACKGKVRLLPVRFNLVANNIGNRYYAYHVCGDPRDREDLLAGRPVICHYVGEAKPWQLLETPWDQAWFACAKRVPATPELARWIARCGERQAPPWTYRTDAVRNAGQVVLYGYTYFSRFLCEALLDEGCGNVRCFLERDPQKQGSSFRGIPCLGSELLDDLPEDALIVICAQTAWQEISVQLQARGIPRDRLARYRSRDHALISV